MGYDGKKVVEANRLKAVGAREVGTFWGENAGVIVILGIIIFLLGVFVWLTFFPPETSPAQEQKARREAREEKNPLRFVPPLFFSQPAPPSPWQKQDGITPIHWFGGHHSNGHHGHHYYEHDWYSHHAIVRPLGAWYNSPFVSYGECYGCDYGRGYGNEEKERRPYFDLHRKPNGETKMRWGFQ